MKNPVLAQVYVVLAYSNGDHETKPAAVCLTSGEADRVVGFMNGQRLTTGVRNDPIQYWVRQAPLLEFEDADDDIMAKTLGVRRAIDLDAFRKEEEP